MSDTKETQAPEFNSEAPLGTPENPIQIDPNNVDENGNMIIPLNFDELDFKSEEEWAAIRAEQEAKAEAEALARHEAEVEEFMQLSEKERTSRLLSGFENLRKLIIERLGSTEQLINEFFNSPNGQMVIAEQLEKILRGEQNQGEQIKADDFDISVHKEQTPGMYPTIWYAPDNVEDHLKDQVVVVRDDGAHPWLPDFAERIREALSETDWYCRDSICYVQIVPKAQNDDTTE